MAGQPTVIQVQGAAAQAATALGAPGTMARLQRQFDNFIAYVDALPHQVVVVSVLFLLSVVWSWTWSCLNYEYAGLPKGGLIGFAFFGSLGSAFALYWICGCCYAEKVKLDEEKTRVLSLRLIAFGSIFIVLSITVALVASMLHYCVIYERNHCMPVPPPTTEYWVRQMADPAGLNASTPAFSVAVPNGHKDIDHLKKAICVEIHHKYPTLISPDLRIHKQGADGTWMEQIRSSGSLVSSTEDSPYGFFYRDL